MKKYIIAFSIFITVIFSFFAFDLDTLLTLSGIKKNLGGFIAWRQEAPFLADGVFFGIYVLVTAMSLPGGTIMSLAAGAIYGLAWGTVWVSFASSIGALLAFLISRHLLHHTIQARFGERLKTINEGITQEGAFYLFTLRLIPIFPFFLVNLLMGLTPMRAITFYWVSQVGMLAGTMVYINAGVQLAKLDGLSGILSPGLMASFSLLGLFPLLSKRLINVWKKRKIYAKWTKPTHFDRNLVVIGGGAAGLVAAYIAAAVKAKVTLIEGDKMGGDCLNTGCVPSKALIRIAKLAHQMRHADHYGLENCSPPLSFQRVMAQVQDAIGRIAPHDSIERYTDLGVEVIQGHGRLVDPWTVAITLQDQTIRQLTTRSIIIATGAKPFVPPLPGLMEVNHVTSDTLWQRLAESNQVPKRIVVLGGGPIGTELAQALARFGAKVCQVEMESRILIREDPEVSEFARKILEKEGVEVLTEHQALHCGSGDDGDYLMVEQAGQKRCLEFDLLVCAVGRVARLEGYGLEELGIETQRTIVTNDFLETLYPNIYAAGDVAGPYQFTHTAAHQAWYAAINALFGDLKRFKVDDRVIPRTTFIDPEVACVGLNEQEAQKKGVAYQVTRYDLAELDRAITDGVAHGFVKVLTPPGKDHILGVTIVGEHAGDLLAECVLAMKYRLGLNKILGTIHTYPTLAEANKHVAGLWKQAHAPKRVLTWLGRYHQWRRGAPTKGGTNY